MKVWITKYALSTGIEEVDADWDEKRPEAVYWPHPNGWGLLSAHGEGKAWHRTQEGAYMRADKMRVAKIASLKKQITKLEKLKFNFPDAG